MTDLQKDKAVLVANIGTSDLEIYLKDEKQDYGYIPLWDRNQPNNAEDQHELTEQEIKNWNQRASLIKDILCRELDVSTREGKGLPFEFVELTQKIKEVYNQNKETWEKRIFASRLLGIVQEVQNSFALEKILIFVSKQNPIFESDTLHLFDILQKWFQDKYQIQLIPKYIDQDINLSRDQDALFEYYYKVFKSFSLDYTILLSLKGGTPAMQTALRTQSITISVERPIILVDTELYIKRVFSGQPSPAYFTSYCNYIKTQKYESVRQLLARWDFDGAMTILEDWKKYINNLIRQNIVDQDIKNNKSFLESIIKVLDITVGYFNLDSSGQSRFKIKPQDDLGVLNNIKHDYDCILNLYTQCRIYWEINQVANFLARMTSFCEEILHFLIKKLDGEKFFDKQQYPDDWYLDKRKFTNNSSQLWQYFSQLERETSRTFNNWNFDLKPKYKLSGRFSKWNFVSALIRYRNYDEEKTSWGKITDSLNKLDYWIDQRNKLIHSAEGVSKANMSKLLENDREQQDENALNACKRDEILSKMTTITIEMRKILKLPETNYIALDQSYYIYSDVKEWIINKLRNDS
ncbi:hypothetical protein [Geminocystis sp. GBBB08]|uniref:hypothetical protein n=1 Tax=Geminocystis sp. GBBB08 TaxID=2604140 RepID=UPI0027E39C5A|nr:hypothetical protein [Geminocystis sp. GBBB08]MBL1208385.1 hypothetical protein [Geminocystis sp. GBBB08]